MKVIIDKTNRKYLYRKGDFHTKYGTIKEEDINKNKEVVSNKGIKFKALEANFYDIYSKIKRGPQIITPKDLGYIIVRTGLNKKSRVIEAGGGSGAVTTFLANIVEKIYVYEIKDKHIEIIKYNLDLFNIKNVEICNCSVINFNHKNIDLLFLDLPEPIEVLESNFKGLKESSYILCYLPSIYQVELLSRFCKENEKKFLLEEITEILKREWFVEDRKVRPKTEMLGHTAFLVFIRYLGK